MLRLLTAGESHGKGLVGDPRGPAGRRPGLAEGGRAASSRGAGTGHGRSGRQKLEADPVRDRLRGPARPDAGQPDRGHDRERRVGGEVPGPDGRRGRDRPRGRLTRPRPGHADLAGALKYGFDDVRNVLERASARETATRVALGAFCKAFLAELGIQVRLARRADRLGRHPLHEGAAPRGPRDSSTPRRSDASTRRPRPGWSPRSTASARTRTRSAGCSRCSRTGARPGSARTSQYDRKLDARLALALMSIQSVKGVEVGDGFASAARPGSKAHDEIVSGRGGCGARARGRAGSRAA